MRLLIFLATLFSLSLYSCQKEVSYMNTGEGGISLSDSTLYKFVTAAQITDAVLKENIDSLVKRAKRHNWWDACVAIYPLAGGTENSVKFNLKNPVDADTAFRLTFIGDTWSFSSEAIHPGTHGYGNTHLNPAIVINDPNSCHLSVYSTEDIAGDPDNSDIGAYDENTWLGFYLSARTEWPDGSGKPFTYVSYDVFQGGETNGSGLFLVTKTVDNVSLYRNASLQANGTVSSGSLPDLELYICNQNFNGAPYFQGYSNRPLSFITIGDGIDEETALQMYSDIQDFVSKK